MKQENISALLARALAAFVAFVVGWVVYMVAMIVTVYDGVLSLIFQPIIAVLCSVFFVMFALLVGLVLKIPILSRWWRGSRLWVLILIVGSLFIMCFGSSLLASIAENFSNTETGMQYQRLHSNAVLISYFVLIFGIANWPLRNKGSRTNEAAQTKP